MDSETEFVLSLSSKSDLEIEAAWKQRHVNSPRLCACVSEEIYDKIHARTTQHPRFVLPFPREVEGVIEFVFVEAQGHVVAFTRLSEFKQLGKNAKPLLVMIHFTQLKLDKKLVLMMGEVDTHKITTQQAAILASLYQIYYLKEDNYQLVKTFNDNPTQFDYSQLLKGLQLKQ